MTDTKPTTLLAALVAAQAEMPALQRDKINPAFHSKYLSLEALLSEVLPVLNRHGFALVQAPTYVETETGLEPALRTVLVHGASGETFEETMLLMIGKRDPQGQGSAITYAKRYALMALCGLSADEDDDGNAASRAGGSAVARRRPSRSAPPAPAAAVITTEQRDQLYTRVRTIGLASSAAKALIKKEAGVDDSSKIPADKFDAVLAALDAVGS